MKYNRFIVALLMCLSLSACHDVSKNPVTPAPAKDKTSEGAQLVGTSSGGGGFADGYAKETLDLAKYALAQMITNTSEEVFSQFPEKKSKDWIVKIIENISYKDVEESRYDRPLKFNYDLNKEQIYATRYYSSTFPYGRFKTRSSKEKLQVLNEVMLDILHELSHFYGIGNTEATDDISDEWAYDFLGKALNEVYHCQKGKDLTSIHAPSGMFFVPLKEYLYDDANDSEDKVHSSILSQELDEYIDSYSNLSFFGIDNKETSQVEESEKAQVDTLVSLALSNKNNDSLRLDKYKIKKDVEEKHVSYKALASSNLKDIFSYQSGSGAGSLYRFDKVESNHKGSEYSFSYSELVVHTEDELVIWGADERKEFPLLTKAVMSIDKSSGEAKSSISILNLEDVALDEYMKEKLSERPSAQPAKDKIKCVHQFEVMDNSNYK